MAKLPATRRTFWFPFEAGGLVSTANPRPPLECGHEHRSSCIAGFSHKRRPFGLFCIRTAPLPMLVHTTRDPMASAPKCDTGH